MASNRSYTNAFSEMADAAQSDAESKLGRKLSDSEADAIRNAGSLIMLESVAMGLHYATTATDVVAHLADAASAFGDRLDAFHSEVCSRLENKLNRTLSAEETEFVAAIPNCLVAMIVLHNIEDADAITAMAEVMP